MMKKTLSLLIVCIALCSGYLSAESVSTPSDQVAVHDPFEGYNRTMTRFNDTLYRNVFRPAGVGYRAVVPKPLRSGIGNVFLNLGYPISFVNNLLQLEFKDAATETFRFGVNSTIGLLGFLDPAKDLFNVHPKREDFGQTLAMYGVKPGPHLVLPVLGPSNTRDMFGTVGAYFIDPVTYVEPMFPDRAAVESTRFMSIVNHTMDDIDALKQHPGDYYLLTRDAYEQRRRAEIND